MPQHICILPERATATAEEQGKSFAISSCRQIVNFDQRDFYNARSSCSSKIEFTYELKAAFEYCSSIVLCSTASPGFASRSFQL
jgi:hypothetical protein